MKIKSAHTSAAAVEGAVNDIKQQLLSVDCKMVLYFASANYLPDQISRAMQNAFPESLVFGCSTSGEITSGKMLDKSLVAMGYSKEAVGEPSLAIVENAKTEQGKGIDKAFSQFEQHFKEPVAMMDFQRYVGLVLFDGLSGTEEKINDLIGNRTGVSFVGGSAGDDLQFKNTYLYANGGVYQNAVVMVLMKPPHGFSILKTQSFDVTGKILTPTKVNEAQRRVIEFDHKPASVAYAEAIGVTEEELPKYFTKNPLGIVLQESDPFVRSPHTKDGTDILFFCSLKEGVGLSILQARDIVTETKQAIQQAEQDSGSIAGIVNFNCILRTLELKDQKRTDDYGAIFNNVPTVGFSTYGETFIGHVNQTATMLLLN